MDNLGFNPSPSTVMHIDLNSCFATIEQQANSHLRGKPIAVAAYATPSGCILAPSVEAKRFGIQTGMRVKEGRELCPSLIVLPPDPNKYRNVHLRLRKLLFDYTNDVIPKSIDEFVLDLRDYLPLSLREPPYKVVAQSPMHRVALDIKERIRKEIGEWLTVSIGIAPNRFLAKVASSLHKPDGLDEINKDNFLNCYLKLKLTDLPYIKLRNSLHLNNMGIYSVLEFFQAPVWKLKAAFSSIIGYYWHTRLHGYEIDDVVFGRRSYGNSYAFPKPLVTPGEIAPILSKLVSKTGFRLRRAGYKAKGIHIAISYRDGFFWHKGVTFPNPFFDSRDIYRQAFKILCLSPYRKPVRNLAVSVFNLQEFSQLQLELFENVAKKEGLVSAVDNANERWGSFVVTPARMLSASDAVPDRIAFGNVKELEEFTLNDANKCE